MLNRSLPAQIPIPVLVFTCALLQFMLGCSEGKFPVRAAAGRVVCDGKPVTVGSVTFSPIGEPGSLETGKPATGAVGQDGTFVLTTNKRFDGAIVGKHRVQYVGAEGEEEEEVEEAESSPRGSPAEAAEYAKRRRAQRAQQMTQCVQKDEIIVEVKADGENDFTIELFPARK